AETVAKPLHRGAGHERAALDRVPDAATDVPRDRREEAAVARTRLVAGIGEQEAARAVRVLRLAGGEARLAEQRRLLIAGEARDRDGRAEVRRIALGDDAAG